MGESIERRSIGLMKNVWRKREMKEALRKFKEKDDESRIEC
jgi:hypothetical protein